MGRMILKFFGVVCVLLGLAAPTIIADQGRPHRLLPIFDDAGRALSGVFDGLPNGRSAADEMLFKPVVLGPCRGSLKPSPSTSGAGDSWGRMRSFVQWLFSVPVVFANDCPWCYEPGNCTGQHITCEAVRCFDGCGGDYNRCFTSPVAPSWRGYCVSNQIVCPACPQCNEQTCWNG